MIVGARVAPVFKIDTAKAHASISPRSEKNAIVMAGAVCFASWWVNLRFVLLGTRQTERKEGCKIRRFFLFGHGSTNYRYNIPSLSSHPPFPEHSALPRFPQFTSFPYDPLLRFPPVPSALFSFNLHAANAPRISSRPRIPPPVLAFNLVSTPLSSGFGGDAFRRH